MTRSAPSLLRQLHAELERGGVLRVGGIDRGKISVEAILFFDDLKVKPSRSSIGLMMTPPVPCIGVKTMRSDLAERTSSLFRIKLSRRFI